MGPQEASRESRIGSRCATFHQGAKNRRQHFRASRQQRGFYGLRWNRREIMARVPYLNREDLPEAAREIFDNLIAERGQPVGNIFRTLAHTPGLLRRFLALGGELRNQTTIDPKLRELALLTVGRITNAEYEFVHHWNLARRVGVTREKLEALADWERSPVYSDQERAVIRYAAEATTDVQIKDATWNALKSFMDNRTIMELVQNVAFYNMVVRVLVPAGVELEPGVKKL
jgi:alkylhydroperoxidase family enzyme